MSTLKGEQSLKKPLSFEFTWTAWHLLEVMEERAVAIHLGGLPGEFGVDLRLAYSDREEHHQVKRTFGSKGDWTLAALGEVLTDFKQRLADPLVHCWFVSTIPAVRLGYLGDKARDSDSLNDFEEKWLTGDYRGWFEDLVNRWELPREECRQRLKRVHTAALNERQIESACLTMLRAMVTSAPIDAWAHLRDFCFDHTHQRITASEVWQWLAARGVERQIIPGDSRLLVSINHQTTEYLSGVRRKLINPPLVRQVSGTIVSKLASTTFGKDVIVLGAPGGGKSAVMLQIADACLEKGWPVLAFRLDELSATTTSTQLQEALHLPLPPAAAIAKASAGKPAVLIIDQLDAVSQYSGRTGTLFNRVSDLIEQIRAHQLRNPIHLVIACREVDWRQDGRFRRLHRPSFDNPEEGIFKVEPLSDEEIKSILANAGYDATSFSPRQRDLLLRRPQYLAILLETHPNTESLQHIVTPNQLFDAYWEQKELALARDIHSASNIWHGVLKCITRQLAETALAITPAIPDGGDDAPLAVKKSLIADFPPQAVRWLISNGVLAESGSRYCFARFFEERYQTLVEYLLDSDQTLIQRGQVRQVLAYQRDESEDMTLYLDSVRDLLEHDQVRPHLKHLVATAVCDVVNPTEAEWQFLVPILATALADIDAGNRTTTACQVFFAFHRSLPFFRMACESGRFAVWLQKAGPPGIVSLFSTIHCHQERAQALVWRLIEPLADEPRFAQALEGLSHFCHAAESRETFEWLLGMMHKVYASDEKPDTHEERFYSLTSDLAEHRPDWLAEWLSAVVVEQAKHSSDHSYELLRDHVIETGKIAPAVENAPKAFLECFLPAIEQVLQRGVGRWFGTWSDFDNDIEVEDSMQYRSPDRAMFDALVDALTKLLKTEEAYATAILNRLLSSEFVALQRLNAAVLCQDQDESAPLAAEFLAKDDHALETSLGGKLAACEMIRKHARRLTPGQSSAIQKRILVCWPSYENERRQTYNPHDSDKCLGNWRGYRQQQLLTAFPHDLLEPLSRRRLEEWERKLTSVERLSLPRRKTNLINKERVIEWSPTRFLEAVIVCQDRAPASSWRGRDELDGKASSILIEAVKKRPEKFVRFLSQCGSTTPQAFISSTYHGLSNLSLEPAVALEAARHFKRLGTDWSQSAIWFLGKVEGETWVREAFPDALHFALDGELPGERSKPDEGKRGDHLEAMASDSVRGTAIETLAQYLWAAPELLEELKPALPALMSEQHPAIQAKLAMLCYAIAFKSEHRDLATELFVRLVENPADEHVLCSRWPFKFMHAGIVDSWAAFRTILERMMASESSEIRSTAASLVCIAVVRGVEALDMAKLCVLSTDPRVRAACANVLSHNLDQDAGKPWTTEAVLTLADDPDKEVCRAVSFGFQGRRRSLDFASLTDFLPKYVRSRAFVRGAGSLIDAITESHAVLPALILDLIESTISRANEPVEDDADRIVWHLQSLSAVLTRIYHENRDGPLRRRTLNLIDKLCIQGTINQDTLDQ